jgi:hypothetical protein
MPDGIMQWYDAHQGEGRIVRGGREYPAVAAEIEPRARAAGARVHFDIRRRDGCAVAVGVRLRAGTRVSRRQRRLGDAGGSRRPDTSGAAPFARPHPELGLALAARPRTVAQRWCQLVGSSDLENATLLYAPDVVVHAGPTELHGTRVVHAWLSSSGLAGHLGGAEVTGADGLFVVRWRGEAGNVDRSWLRIVHGEIAEQWLAGARPGSPAQAPPGELPIEVAVRGGRADAARHEAVAMMRRVATHTIGPVLFARVKLSEAADPAVDRPALAQAMLDVNGQPVRAHVAAHTMTEAIDLLERRLRDQLTHRAEHMKALRRFHVTPEPGEWRHGDVASHRPPYFDRPAEDRQLVRTKSLALKPLTVDEAAFELEALDFDFYLFCDSGTGEDSVIHRLPGGRYGLITLSRSGPPEGPIAAAVDFERRPIPELSIRAAAEDLDLSGELFVFYRNAETGRGNIVYRRYDGHYGLLVPATRARRQ